MINFSILIVDDDKIQIDIVCKWIKNIGEYNFDIKKATDYHSAIKAIESNDFDIIFCDYHLPDGNGYDIYNKTKKIGSFTVFCIMTGSNDVRIAIKLLKEGIGHYLLKPLVMEDVIDVILTSISEIHFHNESQSVLKDENYNLSCSDFIYKSRKMQKVVNLLYKSASSEAPIIIYGETGTGKEVVARMIHDLSNRKDESFVPVNIASLSENLIESELFGHAKGSFTGASTDRAGVFEVAEGGTIFIDELSEIPLHIQVKLLRVLQSHEVTRVGENRIRKINVRVISATNKNLNKMIKKMHFRPDLFYRLNVIPITIPPLRERREDILPLTNFFIDKYNRINNKNIMEISRESVQFLMKYPFHGNVRELEHLIEKGVVLSNDSILRKWTFTEGNTTESTIEKVKSKDLDAQVNKLETLIIIQSLEECHYKISDASEVLGISERRLRLKIKKYNIQI